MSGVANGKLARGEVCMSGSSPTQTTLSARARRALAALRDVGGDGWEVYIPYVGTKTIDELVNARLVETKPGIYGPPSRSYRLITDPLYGDDFGDIWVPE
jgi:hypothetical protein